MKRAKMTSVGCPLVVCSGGGGGLASVCGGGKGISTLSSFSSLLIFFVIVTESVPTPDFSGGQKEVVVTSSRSLYWPYSGSWDNEKEQGHLMGTEKRNVQPIQLCGYRLLEAVRGLCRGNYVGFSRRSDPDMQEDPRFPGDHNPHAWMPSRQSTSRQSLRARFRRNIIDECCMKPCSVSEMLRYCGRT